MHTAYRIRTAQSLGKDPRILRCGSAGCCEKLQIIFLRFGANKVKCESDCVLCVCVVGLRHNMRNV